MRFSIMRKMKKVHKIFEITPTGKLRIVDDNKIWNNFLTREDAEKTIKDLIESYQETLKEYVILEVFE